MLLRDFVTAKLVEEAELIRTVARTIEAEYHGAKVDVRIEQQYRNMADGMTSPEIAEVLKVASTTVDWYGASVQEKLEAKNRIHAVALAIRKGLIP